MDKFLTEQENKMVRLVEERGVAASPYQPVAKKIIYYCKEMLKTNKFNNMGTYKTYDFEIPKEITSKINIVKNLYINVRISDYEDKNVFCYYGGGSVTLKSIDGFSDGKINEATIQIYAFAYNGILIDRTLLNTLYHELNHVWDIYNDFKQTGYCYRFLKSVEKAKIPNDIFDTPEDNELFHIIIYRLFSETELNALIASVYGDLYDFASPLGVNARKNFNTDYKKTAAYYIYELVSNNYKQLFNKIDDKKALRIKNFFNTVDINYSPYGNSTNAFVNELIRKTKHKLKELIKGIGRVASLVYDRLEIYEYHIPPDMLILN